MSKPIVDSQGNPLMGPCCAWLCTAHVQRPKAFCSEHAQNVPVHMLAAIKSDLDYLHERKLPLDEGSEALVRCAARRELMERSRKDPKVFEQIEAARAKESTEEQRIILPGG